MTKEEKQKAIDALKMSAPVMAVTQEEFNNYIQILNQVMDWLDQQTCEDAISRQAVLETIEDCNSDGLKGIFCSYNDGKKFEEYIKALPSVTPKKKTGEWEVCEVVAFGDFKGTEKYKCSECGEKVGVFKSNFCPNCGARMVSK